MAGDLKAQLELSADATGVEAGVNRAKKSLASLGATAKSEGEKAAKGVSGIGDSGQEGAQKLDRATRNIINSIQRTTAALESGGRTSSQYFSALANQRGIDAGVLKPYLDQLDAVKQKQAEAVVALASGSTQFNKYGMSARQTAAALRGVPAQLTDIVVALQGGQAPITVLLQQGGQLKDMFGGIVPAARALGGAVLGLINPFTLAASAVAALGFAYFQGSKEADNYAKANILSGNAAGATVNQLAAMARRLDAITGTQAAAAAALAQFAENGYIAGANIERFTLIALKMEKDAGQAVKETVKQFGELGKSPVEAAIKLNETTNFLTATIYQQIRALDEQGRTADAAALAQKAYADALEGRLPKVQERLGYVERAWRAVAGAAKDAWDAMLNVGRPDTLDDKLAKARERLVKLQGNEGAAALGNRPLVAGAGGKSAIAQAQEELRILESRVGAEARLADWQARSAAQTKARIEFDKDGEQFLQNAAKMEREIAKAKQQGLAAGASQVEIDRRIADIREKYRDKKKDPQIAIDKAQLGLDVQAIKNAAEELIGTYANSERIIDALRSSGLISEREYYESKRAFINLESAAKEDALQKEIARYQQEKLSGKEKIENERKIAEATAKLVTVRADASSKLTILSIQEEAAAKRLASSYLTAKQAAEEYLDALRRQQDREVSGIGQGDRQRQINSGLNQIEDRYASQRRDAENRRAQLELEGRFTEEARAQYEQQLALIKEYQEKATAVYLDSVERRRAAEANWVNGATEAIRNYLDTAANVAKQVEDVFSRAFGGMEDALVKFITTGKLDFKSLATSIVEDITRMIVKAQIMVPLMKALGLDRPAWQTPDFNPGASSGGGWVGSLFGSLFGGLFGGARAIGGPVSAGRMYAVNERRPELLDVGGRQYLMMGNQAGHVSANGAMSGGGIVFNNYQTFAPGTDMRTVNQGAADARRMLDRAGRVM